MLWTLRLCGAMVLPETMKWKTSWLQRKMVIQGAMPSISMTISGSVNLLSETEDASLTGLPPFFGPNPQRPGFRGLPFSSWVAVMAVDFVPCLDLPVGQVVIHLTLAKPDSFRSQNRPNRPTPLATGHRAEENGTASDQRAHESRSAGIFVIMSHGQRPMFPPNRPLLHQTCSFFMY